LIRRHIGPGGAALRRVDAIQFHVSQPQRDFFVDGHEQFLKQRVNFLQVLSKRVKSTKSKKRLNRIPRPSGQRHPLNAGSNFGERRKILRPQIVDRNQRCQSFQFGFARGGTVEYVLSSHLNRQALTLGDAFVLVEKLSDVQQLTFDPALDLRGSRMRFVMDSVLHQQLILI
jgi:hypothetical protein